MVWSVTSTEREEERNEKMTLAMKRVEVYVGQMICKG